jgi:hypothetical protein
VQILVVTREGKRNFGDIVVDGRIIQKRILEKERKITKCIHLTQLMAQLNWDMNSQL